MTISTLAFLALTGTLVVFKLGLMALAVVLLTRTLFPGTKSIVQRPELASLPLQLNARR